MDECGWSGMRSGPSGRKCSLRGSGRAERPVLKAIVKASEFYSE